MYISLKESENYEIFAKKDIEKTLSNISSPSLNNQSVQQDCNQVEDPTASGNDRRTPFRRCCHGGFRRWKHKYYTLIRDSDPENTELGLDIVTFFCSSGITCNESVIVLNDIHINIHQFTLWLS